MAMFMLRGKGGAWFLPAVADFTKNTGGPTLAEIEAGQPLSAAISEITGLEPQRNPINIPLLKRKAEAQIDGPTQFQSVTIGIPDEDGQDTDEEAQERIDALEVLDEGEAGVLLFSRVKQTLAVDDVVWGIRLSVDAQVPLFDLTATYARTNIVCSPSTDLTKLVVKANS